MLFETAANDHSGCGLSDSGLMAAHTRPISRHVEPLCLAPMCRYSACAWAGGAVFSSGRCAPIVQSAEGRLPVVGRGGSCRGGAPRSSGAELAIPCVQNWVQGTIGHGVTRCQPPRDKGFWGLGW